MLIKSLLLDTHVWLWLVNGSDVLSLKIRKMIGAADSIHAQFISVISVCEIAMLEHKKKIVLESSCFFWVKLALSLPSIKLLPLLPEISIESCQLPGSFHGDPADRILVATAKIENLSLLTRDKKILQYATKNFIHVIGVKKKFFIE